MPDDLRYLEPAELSKPFIEKTMIFILPDKLKDFRKNLWHVRKRENEEGAIYVPLFRARCILAEDPVPPGYSGPFSVYPFYSKVARNKRHYLDYYMLFILSGQSDQAKFRSLTEQIR
ncbi:hypothetical protein GOB90_10190 [Acetobacter oeni]|nr:hypothetical protein [Acetobacter oeni]